MEMISLSQCFSAELREVLLAMEAACADVELRKPGAARRGASAIESFTTLADLALAQVRSGELQIDLVLGAQLRDGCACMVRLVNCGTAGTGLAYRADMAGQVLDRQADAFFGYLCTRSMDARPAGL